MEIENNTFTNTHDHSKSMEVEILFHSISNIQQLQSSLEPLVNRLSGVDTNQLSINLKEIDEMVKKVQKSHFRSSEKILTWLKSVKEAIIEFNDLVEDISLKESINKNISIFRWVLSLKSRYSVMRQVTKAQWNLNSLIEEGKLLISEEEKAERNLKSLSEEGKRLISEEEQEQQEQEQAEAGSRRFSNEMFEEVTVVGRENEKKEIIDQLLKLNSTPDFHVAVFVIVGVPGIGKTKLARLVCEDKRVKANFGFEPVWFETFDVDSVVKSATTIIDGCKRRLIVVDDLRNDIKNDLVKVQQQLKEEYGGAGCVILITTRSNRVANDISAARYVLKGLNEQESRNKDGKVKIPAAKSLFQQIRGSTSTSNKQDDEWEMMKDCGGVPLAIIIKAKLMNQFFDQEGGGQIEDVEREFLEELKFIYYKDLPTHYKLCFAFSSLFPEDQLIDAERLIQLWTAEGFLSFSTNSQEEFGFNEFVASVFQQVEKENSEDECGAVRECYRMNRFMHKLAKLVASGENIIVDSKVGVKEGMLRASFDFGLDLSYEIPDWVFDKAKKLRTILLPCKSTNNPRLPHEVKMTTSTCDKIFKAFKLSMRVLDLHDLGIKIVPTSIEEMKYLRFLDLSHNNIEKLPSCITKLIHLQTLKLSYCHVLKELPKDLKDLTRLTHLNIEGCLDLSHMPTGIDKLTSLQTLSLFVASKKHADTGGLRELTDLSHLKGNLEILHLDQVKFSPSNKATTEEFLKNKQHLQHLTLRWDHNDDREGSGINIDVNNDEDDEKLLECLQPHPNLKVLFLVGYNGHTFSNWLHNSIQCLVKFTLSDCHKCKFLPPMDHLPNLKALHLRRLNFLEFISNNSNNLGVGSSSSQPIFFPSLKELTISDCPKLESWWENVKILENNGPSFPCISKLNIRCCPKLACMPLCTNLDEELVVVDSNVRSMRETKTETTSVASLLPLTKLKSMVIERIVESPPENWLTNFISLEELHIRDCSSLKSLQQGFKSLGSLKFLSIERCQELDLENSETEWKFLKNLNFLTLRSIPKLKSLAMGFGNMKSLKELRIYDCIELTSLPENIGNISSLGKLVISECTKLGSLPKGMMNLKLLHTLKITDCPLLTPRCQPNTGDDWLQIAHIENKVVKETSQDLRDL